MLIIEESALYLSTDLTSVKLNSQSVKLNSQSVESDSQLNLKNLIKLLYLRHLQ